MNLTNYNLSEVGDDSFSLDLTKLLPKKTLVSSKLTKSSINNTNVVDIKWVFCLEIKAISLKYGEPEVKICNI